MDLTVMIVSLLLLVEITFSDPGTNRDYQRKKASARKRLSAAGQRKKSNRGPFNSTSDLVTDLLADYVKSDPPQQTMPTEVKLGIYINSFYSISEQTMDYQVSMYLRQNWKDPRLAFEPTRLKDNLTSMRLGDKRWENIWVPDVFFRNEKKAMYHSVTVDNRLLKLNSSGYLWYVTKISATLSCPMKLQKYPLDTQTCPMMFESFGYTMDTMFFSWLEDPAQIDEAVELPQFTLENKILYDCSQNYTGGAFPCLEIRFVLKRDIGYFLIQTYIPSILIVILSWVSFWINPESTPARVSLGLLTVLSMSTHSAGARATLPKVSYIKAIDVWMSVCQIFVFSSLIEFAFVNVYSRHKPQPPPPPIPGMALMGRRDGKGPGPLQRLLSRKKDSSECDGEVETTHINQVHMNENKGTTLCGCIRVNIVENGRREHHRSGIDVEGKTKARRIDKVSRKIFPLAFLLFNLVYWIMYAVPFQNS